METARLAKRIWAYVINLILYVGIGFLASLPFLTIIGLHPLLYVLIAVGIAIVFSFLFDLFLLVITGGFTIGTAIMGIKYVSSNGHKISKKQAFIRSSSESILIFAILDLIYFIRYRTERGVIDRLSNSFAIDNRI